MKARHQWNSLSRQKYLPLGILTLPILQMELASLPDLDFYQIHLNPVEVFCSARWLPWHQSLALIPPDPSGNMLMGSIGYSAFSLLKGKWNGVFWLWVQTLVAWKMIDYRVGGVCWCFIKANAALRLLGVFRGVWHTRFCSLGSPVTSPNFPSPAHGAVSSAGLIMPGRIPPWVTVSCAACLGLPQK